MDAASPAGQEPAGTLEVSLCPRRGCWQEVEGLAPSCPSCRRSRPDDGWVKGPRPGRLIHRKYRLEKILGLGGFGLVYLARQVQQDFDLGPVVLKFLHRRWAEQQGFRLSFIREMQAIRKLGSHPHVVTVFDLEEEETGLPFMVMEYLPGETLQDLLERKKRLPLDQALNIAGQVANALGACHAAGIVHRDLKPDNIRLLSGKTDFVKVLDFGIARDTLTRQTIAHTFVGTPQYMSPEQILLQPVDGGADIYALGVVLFESLAGRPPIQARTPMEYIKLNIDVPPAPLRSVCPEMPPSLDALLERMMNKERSQRPASMEEVERRLKDIAAECGARFYLEDPPDTWRETRAFSPAGQAQAEPVPGPSPPDSPAVVSVPKRSFSDRPAGEPAPDPVLDTPGDGASPLPAAPEGVRGASTSDLLHQVSKEMAHATTEPPPSPVSEPFSGSLSELIPNRRLQRPLVLAGLGLAALLALLAFAVLPGGDTRAGAGSTPVLPQPVPGPSRVATTPAARLEPEDKDPARPDLSIPDQGQPSLQAGDDRPPASRPKPPAKLPRTKRHPRRARKPSPRRSKAPVIRALPAPPDDSPEPVIRALPPSPEEKSAP